MGASRSGKRMGDKRGLDARAQAYYYCNCIVTPNFLFLVYVSHKQNSKAKRKNYNSVWGQNEKGWKRKYTKNVL